MLYLRQGLGSGLVDVRPRDPLGLGYEQKSMIRRMGNLCGMVFLLMGCQSSRWAGTNPSVPTSVQAACAEVCTLHDAVVQNYLQALEIIAHNLANADTVGYKRIQAHFEEGLALPSELAGDNPAGAVLCRTSRVQTPGELKQTGERLDVAIQGEGFFEVVLPNGTLAYTRNGTFHVATDGRIVTHRGYPLQGEFQPIPEHAAHITITAGGAVQCSTNQGTSSFQLQLCQFAHPEELQALGYNLYRQTAQSGPPEISNPGQNGSGELLQGFLEFSNVNVAEELSALIRIQRTYLAYLRVEELSRDLAGASPHHRARQPMALEAFCQTLNVLAQRLQIATANIANARVTRTAYGDPYQRQIVAGYTNGFCTVVPDRQPPRMVYAPGHPDANQEGFVAYPNINVLEEMVALKKSERALAALWDRSPVDQDFFVMHPRGKAWIKKYPAIASLLDLE